MFKCGDKVLYGSHGICEIIGVESKRIDRKNIEYFVLQPIEQSNAKFFIPTQSETAISKLRPILTENEISALLKANTSDYDDWIPLENQRKQRYKELISSGDRAALIRMVHALHKHRQLQQSAGRKLHLCDENFLRDAEKIISAEFSLVLNISQDEVKDFVHSVIHAE